MQEWPTSLSDIGGMFGSNSAMSRFVDCGRDQAFLLPPDLREWIPEDDLAHFVIEAVERVDMGAFKVNRRGTGSAQYHPRMMLALLIYCYANGIFSSRRIERATRRDIGVRFVAANSHPDHDTIATFRRDNLAAVGESFLQVLLLAKELKLVKLGVVSVDGSKFAANASKHRSVRYDRAGELIEELRLEIAALMERAEAADDGAAEDPQALPREIARREALRDRLDAARRCLEARAKARAGRKGRAKGKRPKPPGGTPRGDEQSNLSDPDSRLMRKSKRHEFRQAYNAQAVVDAGGSQRLDHATAPVHFPVAIDNRLGLTQSGCPGWTGCGREGSGAAAPSRRSIRRPQGRGVSRCRNLPCGSRPRAS